MPESWIEVKDGEMVAAGNGPWKCPGWLYRGNESELRTKTDKLFGVVTAKLLDRDEYIIGLPIHND